MCNEVNLSSFLQVCENLVLAEGQLRLVGGSTDNEGRLEIMIDFQWGTVCIDSFDVNSAKVACKQLGKP